jgi:flagellar hook-associated protein 1 FlgK
MLGLFGTLNLGTRALQAQRTAVEVAGQNLANVNNPAYSRQRVQIESSIALPSSVGPQGTGADAIAIQQIRDFLLDGQMQNELSVGGYWESQQRALQYAQVGLGEIITSSTSDSTGTGLSAELNRLFAAFSSVSNDPGLESERGMLINHAQTLASRLNQTAARLDDLRSTLDSSLRTDVDSANKLLAEIAKLNDRIAVSEMPNGGTANDLRDLRQQKVEELSKLINIETSSDSSGSLNISVNGNMVLSGHNVVENFETYDAGGGQMLVRLSNGTPLTPTSGAMQGKIDVRDGTLASMRSDLDALASELITQVNTVHSAGFALDGTTGANFFTGTNAANIGVNADLVEDPNLIQAAGVAGASGDGAVAAALASLGGTSQAALGNQTFSERYSGVVAKLGYALEGANEQVADHEAVKSLLTQQRASVSGVSIDEEMSDLIRFQKAYEASAKLISTVDEMLDTILSLKR